MPQTFNLPQLPSNAAIVDAQGKPTPALGVWWQQNRDALIKTLNAILQIPEIQAALESAQTSIVAANDAAMAAAAAAQAANEAAAQAQATTDATKREAALQSSYISPDSVITADTTTVYMAAHTRYYGDGTSVTVNAGSGDATFPGNADYVSYSDPQRVGGDVQLIISTTAPTQTGDIHVVGAVVIPASGTQNGGAGPRKPGYVQATDS